MEPTKTFSAEETTAQIQRIAASAAFKNSPILVRFLEFIVSETLQGKGSSLKEYTIALNVLKRSSDFNPQDDAVVRIHAGRLRRALNDYYFTQGINDPIVVHIPKGCYVPQFDEKGGTAKGRSLSVLPELNMNPVVAVFPFKAISPSSEIHDFAMALGEQLSAELSRFSDLSAIGYYSADMSAKIDLNMLDAGKFIGADYIISGSLRSNGDNLRVSVNLLITATGEVLMTKSYESKSSSHDIFHIQDEIVESVIRAVGGSCGLIFQEMAKASPQKVLNHKEVRNAIHRFYKYQCSHSIENYNEACSALELAVKDQPNHATSWAMLGELYMDGLALERKSVEDPVEEGYKYAQQALKIDPLCQQAWQTLTWFYLLKGEKDSVIQTARRCIQLNPNNSAIALGVGFALICAGAYEEGFPIMQKGFSLNPYCPWWINCGFSFYYLHEKKYEEALFWAERTNSEETFWDPLLKSTALSHLGKKKEARKYLLKVLDMEPDANLQIKIMLSTFLLCPELVDHITEGLNNAGLQEVKNIDEPVLA